MTARPPIGAPPLWTSIVDRDGGQCTCTGACGRRHASLAPGRAAGRKGRGPGANAVFGPVARCTAGRADERLVVVPTDPAIRDSDAWKLPATALTTRCEPCAHAARSRSRTAPSDLDCEQTKNGQAQLALLALPDLPEVAGGPVRDRQPARPQRKAGPR